MPTLITPRGLAAFTLAVLLAGCSTPDPVMYRDIGSARYLRPDNGEKHIPYRYRNRVDWRQYSQAIVAPTEIYQGTDNQFGDMNMADRAKLASYMYSEFSTQLSRRFQLTTTPTPGTLRVKMTLTGASTTTPVLGTLSHFDIAGGLYNGIQSFRGGEGSMMGAVIYVVEIYDANTSQLLSSYIAKQYPNSMNIGSTFGSLATAKTGIDKGAQELMTQFD